MSRCLLRPLAVTYQQRRSSERSEFDYIYFMMSSNIMMILILFIFALYVVKFSIYLFKNRTGHAIKKKYSNTKCI